MPTAILIWVWFCAYLNCAGWTLSALHQLNATGYAVALLLGGVAFVALVETNFRADFPASFLEKIETSLSPAISARVSDFGDDGFSGRRVVCAKQL